jgi:hypothetical protein
MPETILLPVRRAPGFCWIFACPVKFFVENSAVYLTGVSPIHVYSIRNPKSQIQNRKTRTLWV